MSGLTQEQLDFFHREGYVHVPGVLGDADLAPVQADLEEIDLRWNDARMPNGRPHLPGLYIRTSENPGLVVRDREEWVTAWKFAPPGSRGARFYRWTDPPPSTPVTGGPRARR